jgi:hypothetical protein
MCLSSRHFHDAISREFGRSLRCRRTLSLLCEGLISLDGRSLAAGGNARPFRVETRFNR